MSKSALFVGLLALIFCQSAFSGDPVAGEKRASQCAPCHGLDGIGRQPNYPNLAGQKEEYMILQLWNFKRGGRKNPSMKMQVRNIDGADIENLAAYYSSLTCRPQ